MGCGLRSGTGRDCAQASHLSKETALLLLSQKKKKGVASAKALPCSIAGGHSPCPSCPRASTAARSLGATSSPSDRRVGTRVPTFIPAVARRVPSGTTYACFTSLRLFAGTPSSSLTLSLLRAACALPPLGGGTVDEGPSHNNIQ